MFTRVCGSGVSSVFPSRRLTFDPWPDRMESVVKEMFQKIFFWEFPFPSIISPTLFTSFHLSSAIVKIGWGKVLEVVRIFNADMRSVWGLSGYLCSDGTRFCQGLRQDGPHVSFGSTILIQEGLRALDPWSFSGCSSADGNRFYQGLRYYVFVDFF